jgi:adenosylcobyric acid synthase
VSQILREISSRTSDDLLIASTNTDAGKNLLMCGILRAAKKRGVRLKPFKPLELDYADGIATTLSPGMHQKARSAGVPLVGDMCPFWIVYNYHERTSNLYLCGEHKGCVSHDHSGDPVVVRNTIDGAVKELKKDGSRLVIEAPGAFSESHSSLPVKAVLETLQPDIVLIGDFLRGGGLAFLIGTIELLSRDIRRKIVGVVLNHIDQVHGSEYPILCSQQLNERYGIPVIGMLPTYREGFDTISEHSRTMPTETFDSQVDRLAIELESRLHQSVMKHL